MKLTDSEWSVMSAAWERAPVTVREVHEQVRERTGWAYTTVKTLMERLVEKGALTAAREGRATIYCPAVTQSEARGDALRSLLRHAFGGTVGSLVQHLVTEEKLTAKEREQLREIAAGRPARKART